MGRPSKLTPELVEEICGYVKDGLSYEDAFTSAGISHTSFYRWKARGIKAQKGKFRDFWDALEKANADLKAQHLTLIQTAAQKPSEGSKMVKRTTKTPEGEVVVTEAVKITKPPDWRASAWLLEHRWPKEFGRSVQEHSGKVGVDHSGKVETSPPPPPARFRHPDGQIYEYVPLESPEQVRAHKGRVPEDPGPEGLESEEKPPEEEATDATAEDHA